MTAVWWRRGVFGKYKFMTTDDPKMLENVDMFFWTAISGRADITFFVLLLFGL